MDKKNVLLRYSQNIQWMKVEEEKIELVPIFSMLNKK